MRAARSTDAFALAGLLEQQFTRSRYAGTAVQFDAPYVRKLIAQAIQRHGHTTDGGSLVNVIEQDGGSIAAFCVGVLSRAYHVGNLLAAQDLFLVAAPDAPALATRTLLRAYLDWAEANPACFEINLSHTDVLPEGERMAPIYRRLGFTQCGSIYRRDRVLANSECAA